MSLPASFPSASPPQMPAEHAGGRVARRRFQPKKKSYALRATLVALLLAFGAGGAYVVLRPAAVTTTPVVRGTAIDAVYATGTVEPLDRVLVRARSSGTIDLKVREGARVKKGDLLATIDSPALKHELEQGKADMWGASQQATSNGPQLAALKAQARSLEAELNTARSDQRRIRSLVASGSSPQAELDRADDRIEALDAQLAAINSQRQSLRIDLT